MLKCGRGQVLRFRWVRSGQVNCLPLISFGQFLCNNTPFNKIKFGAKGIILFCDVIFLVVAILFVLMGSMYIYIFFWTSQGPAV